MCLCETELLEIELFWHWNCVLMLNWNIWNRTFYMFKMDLALNNLQWLMCRKTKTKNADPEIGVEGSNVFIYFWNNISTNVYFLACFFFIRKKMKKNQKNKKKKTTNKTKQKNKQTRSKRTANHFFLFTPTPQSALLLFNPISALYLAMLLTLLVNVWFLIRGTVIILKHLQVILYDKGSSIFDGC